MNGPEILFLVSLLCVAFLYSSVGHGGASAYLAIMALFSYNHETMRSTALVLNIFVSAIAFYQYYRAGHFNWDLFWPFALASIPASFLGGMITLDENIYKKILGVLLLFSVARLLFSSKQSDSDIQKPKLIISLFVGLIIGLISGIIGIGGGIILSPLILLMNWAKIKSTAAVSALFIFVNSLSGLLGNAMNGIQLDESINLMVIVALIGGFCGSYVGSSKFNTFHLKMLLSLVLLIATIKLFTT
ncbi:MAG: sulfite exporter TauE/SafE family protein [Saprospiraceae bacterium]